MGALLFADARLFVLRTGWQLVTESRVHAISL
jgi:hypothetical protein